MTEYEQLPLFELADGDRHLLNPDERAEVSVGRCKFCDTTDDGTGPVCCQNLADHVTRTLDFVGR